MGKRQDDRVAFDPLWTHVSKHMMPYNQENHLLPLEIFLFTMILEEHKEIRQIRRMLAEVQLIH